MLPTARVCLIYRGRTLGRAKSSTAPLEPEPTPTCRCNDAPSLPLRHAPLCIPSPSRILSPRNDPRSITEGYPIVRTVRPYIPDAFFTATKSFAFFLQTLNRNPRTAEESATLITLSILRTTRSSISNRTIAQIVLGKKIYSGSAML